MLRKAECCCRSVAIEVEGDPTIHAVCHCENCKRRTGSAFGISAYFMDSAIIRISGKAKSYEFESKSSATRQTRHFCETCGTTLYWKISTLPNLTAIAGGCFTETPLGEPKQTVSNENRCSWVKLPESWKDSW